MATTAPLLEDHIPVVKYNGLQTDENAVFGGNLTVLGTTTIAAVTLTDLTVTGDTVIGDAVTDTLTITGATSIESTSASSLAVGLNGATNPVLKVDSSTASQATGLSLTGAAAAGGMALAVISSGTNEDLTIDAKGSGTITLNGTATGAVTITPAATITGLLTLTAGIDAKVIATSTETIAAGGTTTALDLASFHHDIDADAGGDIFTLADGIQGQLTVCVLKTATGIATITPATFLGGTSVTLNAAGDSVMFRFQTTLGWSIVGGNSFTVI